MFRKVAPACLLAAWLCASGAVLDLAQAAAWVRMFAGYARTESLASAARETFDPSKPCELCKAVCKAKEAAQHAPAIADKGAAKLVLILEKSDVVPLSPSRLEWPDYAPLGAGARVSEVPLPPPRGLRA